MQQLAAVRTHLPGYTSIPRFNLALVDQDNKHDKRLFRELLALTLVSLNDAYLHSMMAEPRSQGYQDY